MRVLLLERRPLPRDKPCGGGVTVRAAALAAVDILPVVERTIYGARVSLALGPHKDLWHHLPLTYMTQRWRLDHFLAQLATEAGAELHDGEGAISLQEEGTGMVVRTSRDAYRASVVIGADGANGLSARFLGARATYEEAVALEAHVPLPADTLHQWRELVALDLGSIAGGYGWVFPKGDHLNVGVGGWKYASHLLRARLRHLCQRYRLPWEKVEGLRGHHLPLRRPHSPLVGRSLLLVGDAAGLVDPLSGEGIHMAFASAALAAEAVLRFLGGQTPHLFGYAEAVERDIGPELATARMLQEVFHLAPPPFVAVLWHSRHFWRLLCHLIRGEIGYRRMLRLMGPLGHLVPFFAAWAQRRRLTRVRDSLTAFYLQHRAR